MAVLSVRQDISPPAPYPNNHHPCHSARSQGRRNLVSSYRTADRPVTTILLLRTADRPVATIPLHRSTDRPVVTILLHRIADRPVATILLLRTADGDPRRPLTATDVLSPHGSRPLTAHSDNTAVLSATHKKRVSPCGDTLFNFLSLRITKPGIRDSRTAERTRCCSQQPRRVPVSERLRCAGSSERPGSHPREQR